ncbi:MAG: LysE family transporter [Deltaproteobacteria bacterium]|nr:LysE family transporter [Deltaproteobacteria bacterium]
MILAGFFIGFIYSIPLGPLGQIMLNRSIKRGFWHGFSIGIFGAIADFFLCEMFLIGMEGLNFSPKLKLIVQGIGVIFLAYVGIKEIILPLLFKDKKDEKKEVNQSLHLNKSLDRKCLLKNLFLVMGYHISNPTILAFWLNMSEVIKTTFIIHQTLFNYTVFSATLGMGILTCQYVSIVLAKKVTQFKNTIFSVRYVTFILFSLTMLYFIIKIIQDIQV